MKIKNISWFIFIASLIGSFTFEISDFLNGNVSTVFNIKSLAVVLSAFFILVICALADKKTMSVYSFEKNIFSGIFAFLSGFYLCFEAVKNIIVLSNPIEIIPLIDVIMSFICALGIFVIGFAAFTGKYNVKSMPFFAALPVFYGSYKLVEYFIFYTKQSIVSSQIYDILAIIGMLLFFFYSASAIVKIPNKSIIKCTYIYGISAIVLSFLWCGNMILSTPDIKNLESIANVINPDAVQFFLFSLYALSVLIEITKNVGTKTGYELEDDDFSEEEKIYGKIERKNISYSNNEPIDEEIVDYSSMFEDKQENEKQESHEDLDWLNQLDEALHKDKNDSDKT